MKFIVVGDWAINPKKIVAHRFYVERYEESRVNCYIEIYLENVSNPTKIYLKGSESNCKSEYWDFEEKFNKLNNVL